MTKGLLLRYANTVRMRPVRRTIRHAHRLSYLRNHMHNSKEKNKYHKINFSFYSYLQLKTGAELIKPLRNYV